MSSGLWFPNLADYQVSWKGVQKYRILGPITADTPLLGLGSSERCVFTNMFYTGKNFRPMKNAVAKLPLLFIGKSRVDGIISMQTRDLWEGEEQSS